MAQATPGHNPSQGFAAGTGEKVGKVPEHLCPQFLQPDTQDTGYFPDWFPSVSSLLLLLLLSHLR